MRNAVAQSRTFQSTVGFGQLKANECLRLVASNVLQAIYMGMCRVLDSSDPSYQLLRDKVFCY